MVGRSDLFWYVSVYVDPVVVSFRGVIEGFTTLLALVGLFTGVEGFMRLKCPLARESPLAVSAYIILELQVNGTYVSPDHITPSLVATKANFPPCIGVVLQQKYTSGLVPLHSG